MGVSAYSLLVTLNVNDKIFSLEIKLLLSYHTIHGLNGYVCIPIYGAEYIFICRQYVRSNRDCGYAYQCAREQNFLPFEYEKPHGHARLL